MDYNRIKLSVIIPVYNSEKYIKNTLNIIFAQITSNVEIILIDDGSTDDTYKIIQEYIAAYEFINDYDGYEHKNNIVLCHQENGGCSSARNLGLKKCRGEYVTFMDADDVVREDYFKSFIQLIEDNDSFDVCITGVETYNEKGELFERVQNLNRLFENHSSSVTSIVYDETKIAFPMWSKIVNVAFLRENNVEFDCDAKCMSDGLFYSKVYQYINRMVLSDYVGYEWRRRPGSISASYYDNTTELVMRYVENCKKIVESVKELKDDEIAKQWLLKKKKFGFDYPINRINNAGLTTRKRRECIRAVIENNLDYEIIDTHYYGVERILLFLSKKRKSYFFYAIIQVWKSVLHDWDRLTGAVSRRLVRR